MNFSLSFNSLDRPECLRRAMASVCDNGWKFASKLVCDDASTDDNFDKILHYCEEYEFDVIRKTERCGWPNSCNLSMIYGDSRYAMTSNDDMVIPKGSEWLKKAEEGFDKGYVMVSILRLDTYALDKRIIPKIGWHDERYPFIGIEDGDWIIRMKLYVGNNKDFCYAPGILSSKDGNDLIAHTFHSKTLDEPRIWIVEEENKANRDFFHKKWKVDKEKIFAKFPKLRGGDERVIAQKAYGMLAVTRRMEEEDFYPSITRRYERGNFSAWPKMLPCVSEIYGFNKGTI